MLRYAISCPHLPRLAGSRPLITDRDRQRAAASPPLPVPFHCKPWTDGQSAGWSLPYGYRTPLIIQGLADGLASLPDLAELAAESGEPEPIRQPVPGLLTLATGYAIRTAPGTAALLIAANDPPPNFRLVMSRADSGAAAVTVWVAFRAPAEGETVDLKTGAEIARIVEVPLEPNAGAHALTSEEQEVLRAEEMRYLHEERLTPTRWTAANGQEFTHLYKIWSRRNRRARREP